MALESRPRAEIQNVQALRAFAATIVALSHLSLFERDWLHGARYFWPWQYIGPTGVDLFFAISGFIMVYTNWRSFGQPGASWRFMLRRIIRIFPIYWIATLAILAAQHALHEPMPDPRRLLLAVVLLPQAHYPPVGVAWSLIYEMFFYYVFAVAIWFRRSLFAWLIAGWVAIVIALNVALHGGGDVVLRTLSSPFNLEFILGVCVGLLTINKRLPSRPYVTAFVAAVVVGVCLAHLASIHGRYSGAPHGGWDRFLYAGLPMALLLYACVALEMRGVVFPKLICSFGNASYSLYLWHEFMALLCLHAVLRFTHQHEIALAATTLFTFAACVVLYATIERPITLYLQRVVRGKGSRAPAPQTA